MITRDDYFAIAGEVPSLAVEKNAAELLVRLNALLAFLGMKTGLDSGWRPPKYNAELRRLWIQSGGMKGANTAINSKHITGEAADVRDNQTQDLANRLLNDPTILEKYNLWMEHPSATRGRITNWCHLQSVPPASGRRVFYPY